MTTEKKLVAAAAALLDSGGEEPVWQTTLSKIIGRSRGGLTSKIHAVVDSNGLPVDLALTPGEAHDNPVCSVLLSALLQPTMLLADRGIRRGLDQGACPSARRMGEHSAETLSQRPDLLQLVSVSRAQPDRTVLQQDQAMSGRCGPIRQTRGQIPSLRQARVNPHLAAC